MADLPNAAATVAALGQRRAAALALKLSNQIKENLSQPGSGRTYRHGGVEHQASAPGESPAVNHGDLRRSIMTQQLADGFRVGVSAGAGGGSVRARAPALEFGARDLAPRPYIRPALEALKGELGS